MIKKPKEGRKVIVTVAFNHVTIKRKILHSSSDQRSDQTGQILVKVWRQSKHSVFLMLKQIQHDPVMVSLKYIYYLLLDEKV